MPIDPFTRYLPALERAMRQAIPDTEPKALYGMLRYHLGWVDTAFQPVTEKAGKRLRPVFLLLAYEAQACQTQNGDWQHALPAAVAIELLHNFTLIHDDIEDRDRTRRGRPTLWAVWGEAQAINAGDALFTLAYRSLFNLQTTPVPTDIVLRAAKRYTDVILHITEGQHLDLSFEGESQVDMSAYLSMIQGKTAALLGLSCELGGMLAGAPEARLAALWDFGVELGLAFQMQDDWLGLWGDPAQTGKPVGSDLRNHKKTLPILHGMAHSAAFQALVTGDTALDDARVAEGLALLEDAGSQTYVQAQALTHHQAALAALARSEGDGAAQAALYTLAEQLVGRAT